MVRRSFIALPFLSATLIAACGEGDGPPLRPCSACADGGLPADAGSCTGDCSVDRCGFHLNLESDTQFLRFENEERQAEVIIQRELVGSGAGHSGLYELRGFALGLDGEVECHTSGLSYENSHHNWFDRARVQTREGLIQLGLEFQPSDPNDPLSEWAWRFPLTGTASGGGELFAPIALRVVEGNPQGQ